MDSATRILIVAGLFIAWSIGPTVILLYRLNIVPLRLTEILDRFSSKNPGELLASNDDRAKSGAWHYARLLSPSSEPANPTQAIEDQFWRFHGWNRYRVPLALVIILSGLMLAFSGLWLVDRLCPSVSPATTEQSVTSPGVAIAANPATLPVNANYATTKPAKSSPDSGLEAAASIRILGRIPPPFVMALWGAYVWSLYEILSRKKSGDLTPVELYDIAARYVTAIPIGYAFSLLVFDTVPSLAAFAVSALPLRDIRQYLRKYTLSKLDEKPPTTASSDSKGYLSDVLNGLGNDTIARLEELNIETYLDLAYADPIKLLIKTGVPIELVLSWIDQAMVCVYAAPYKAALTAYCLPCALDLCEFFSIHCWDVGSNQYKATWNTDPAVQSLAAKLGIPVEFLVKHMLRGIFEDPHTRFLVRVWFGPAQAADAM